MTATEKRATILALRKAAKILEEELEEIPVSRKRPNKYRQHIENTVAVGIWRKPDFLKKKKPLLVTKAN